MPSDDSGPFKSDVEQLFHHLSRAHHLMITTLQREIDGLGVDGKLQPGMRPLICTLVEEDGLSVSDLAKRLNMAKSSVTGAIKRMESAGVVDLIPDEKDLRIRRVQLTSEGRALKPLCVQIDRAVSKRLDSVFTETDLAQLQDLLARLISVMGNRDDS